MFTSSAFSTCSNTSGSLRRGYVLRIACHSDEGPYSGENKEIRDRARTATASMATLKVAVLQVLLLALGMQYSSAWVEEEVGNQGVSTAWAWSGGDSGGRVGDVSLGQPKEMKYTREKEVTAKCPKLTLRTEEPPTRTKRRRPLMQRLSFSNGDWEQKDGARPIMPFIQLENSSATDYKVLAKTQVGSFWVTDVTKNQKPVRNVAGMVELVITNRYAHRNEDKVLRPISTGVVNSPSGDSNPFLMNPGFSSLRIEVEGIYQQAKNEDVLCMLGCTYLPVVGGNWEEEQISPGTVKSVKDCEIMIQLHYPLNFNLTSRVIRGQITSLKSPDQAFYFPPISLSSAVTAAIVYESTAKGLVSSVCDSEDSGLKYVDSYRAIGLEFCRLAHQYLKIGWLDVDTNWNCTGTSEYCGKLGPFLPYSERSHQIEQSDYNSSRAEIVIQSFRSPCFYEEETEFSVSAVFRLVPADETRNLARLRSALDGQTIVTEGYWKNGSDHLCMVGCSLNDNTGQADLCDMRVCLSIPLTLSIKHRNIFEGTISSTQAKSPFYPLSFRAKLAYNQVLPWRLSSQYHYNYSKLEEANSIVSKYEPQLNTFHTSWLSYPKLIGDNLHRYRDLVEDLTLNYALESHKSQEFSFARFSLTAIDDYLPFVSSGSVETGLFMSNNDTIQTQTDPNQTHRLKETRQYLNVAGSLSLVSSQGNSLLELSTEGMYNPKDGKMYMVGCRKVTLPWEVIQENSWALDEGMDCAIEVVFVYPATFASWVTNPSVQVIVSSQRTEDSPFHFAEIKIQTAPILYRSQRVQLVSQRSVEGALSVLTLSLILASIISQLLYIGQQADSSPYISLVMIAIQAMGYAIPLVTGAEALLTRKFDYRRDSFFQEGGWARMIVYLDKLLTLVAFLLMVRVFEVVWRSRAMVQEAARVPRERGVAVMCLIIHALGFISVVALHSQKSTFANYVPYQKPVVVQPDELVADWYDVNKGPVWKLILQEYAGLVEDLFLLPQAIAFSLWDIQGKPLRKIYFVGLTLLQIVPHVYDSFRAHGLDGFSLDMYANPSFDFYTNLGNVLIPVLALILAVLVYIQQRWKNFLRFPSRFLYQPLSSKMNETELVQNHGRTPLPPIPEDDE